MHAHAHTKTNTHTQQTTHYIQHTHKHTHRQTLKHRHRQIHMHRQCVGRSTHTTTTTTHMYAHRCTISHSFTSKISCWNDTHTCMHGHMKEIMNSYMDITSQYGYNQNKNKKVITIGIKIRYKIYMINKFKYYNIFNHY